MLICLLTSCNTKTDEIMKMESPKTNNPNAQITHDVFETDDDTALAIGGSIPATEFRNSFILLPDTLSHIIDMERLPEWEKMIKEIVDSGTEDPYLYDNIYEFIRFFDIPREQFEELYYSTNLYYLFDYNFDLLYSDDVEKVYAYYKDENEDFIKRNTELSIKQDIKNLVGIEDFNAWLYKKKTIRFNDYYDVSWSIAEAIYEFKIPQKSIEKILYSYASDEDGVAVFEVYEDGTEIPITGNTLMYEYDLEMIYNDKSELMEMFTTDFQGEIRDIQNVDTALDGYEIDEMIRK